MLYDDQKLRLAFGDHLRPGGTELTRRALSLFSFPKGGRIADLGCGTGSTLKLLRELGFDAVGLDISPTLLTEAAKRGPVVEGDFHYLPWPDHCLDGIFCECSLSLAEDPRQALLECARVLKKSGGLVISDLTRKREIGIERRSAETENRAFGVMTADELSTLLITTGFSLRHQINQDKALNELAARLVWNLGSTDKMKTALGLDREKSRDRNEAALKPLPGGRRPDKRRSGGAAAPPRLELEKLGYQLIIAEKDIR